MDKNRMQIITRRLIGEFLENKFMGCRKVLVC
jgi:hypothetical protein